MADLFSFLPAGATDDVVDQAAVDARVTAMIRTKLANLMAMREFFVGESTDADGNPCCCICSTKTGLRSAPQCPGALICQPCLDDPGDGEDR